MNFSNRANLLERFDLHRGIIGENQRVLREFSPDKSECRIIRVKATPEKIAEVIAAEKALSNQFKYTLEWKVYEYDSPSNLVESLLAAGFQPEDEENVLVFPLSSYCSEKKMPPPETKLVRIQNEQGLQEVAEISYEIGRQGIDAETKRLASILNESPELMSIYVLYKNDKPISCGRVHYQPGSEFAELAGHRTKITHRRRGYFSFLVHYQLIDIMERGYTHVFVDALPISESILKRIGFVSLTRTRPYIYKK